jgi:NAD(P)-dependent dehydrogenase (short-subunit alcohol dehydrogenase family)
VAGLAGIDFADKKCFINGAASGIGRATALAAGRKGAVLLLTDIDAGRLEEAAEAVRSAGGKVALAAPADVSDHEAVTALAGRVHEAHGSVDVVMNVAGISTWGAVEELTHEDWRAQIDVNLMGPIHVIESFIPPMIRAGRGGRLVNVSSAAGLFGLPWHAAYSAAKFGLRGISEVLRFDLERHGIGVTLVCPGAVDTPLVETVKIIGVDREHPAVRKMQGHFRRRAVSSERVAELIVDAVERDRYLVLTSRDIKIGHWFQRKFSLPYRVAMRRLNDRMVAVATRSRRG